MVVGTQVVMALVCTSGTVEVIGGGGGGTTLDVLAAAELVGTMTEVLLGTTTLVLVLGLTVLVLYTGTVVLELTTSVDVLGAAELDGVGVTTEVEVAGLVLLDVYGQLLTSGPQLKMVCSCVTNAVEVAGSAPALLVVAGADTDEELTGGGPYPIGVMAGLAMTAPARATRVRA